MKTIGLACGKLDRVAPLIKDRPRTNSIPLQNPPLCLSVSKTTACKKGFAYTKFINTILA